MADKVPQWKNGDLITAAKLNAMVDAINELEVNQGFQGEQGPQGPQGPQGEKGEDGHTPVKGVDYFTEADKKEMLKDYATKQYVDDGIAGAQLGGVEGGGGGNVNLSNYATKSYVNNMVDEIKAVNMSTRYQPVNKKIFEGKKLAVLGDSITFGVGTTHPIHFPELLVEQMGFSGLVEKGFSNYGFSYGLDDYGYSVHMVLDAHIDALAEADVLLVCLGVNDWLWGRDIDGDKAIGNLLDESKYTVCGAINLLCQRLQEAFANKPDAKIYFVTPAPTKKPPGKGGNTGETWDQNKLNHNGNSLRDICHAIIQTAALYGYQSLDMNLYLDANVYDYDEMDSIFPDGCHPNEEGNRRIANTIEKLLIANPITAFSFNPLVTTLDPLVKKLIYRNANIIIPDLPDEPTEKYTITYKYECEGVGIKADTTELVNGGTVKVFNKSNAPDVEGYIAVSVVPPNATVDGDMTVTYNYMSVETGEVEVFDLSTLELAKLNVEGTETNNLIYNNSAHTLSIENTGWYMVNYFTNPVRVGTEIEIKLTYGADNNATGGAIGLYNDVDLTKTTVPSGRYYIFPKKFGIYMPHNAASSFQSEEGTGVLKYADGANVTQQDIANATVRILLKEEGAELFINDRAITLYKKPELDDARYFLGLRASKLTAANPSTPFEIKYIGPIRDNDDSGDNDNNGDNTNEPEQPVNPPVTPEEPEDPEVPVEPEPEVPTEAIDLSTLQLAMMNKEGTTTNNLVYDTTDHTLSIENTGWNMGNYFTTPLTVGMQVEVMWYVDSANTAYGTSGAVMGLYTESDIQDNNYTTGYWVQPYAFGLYTNGGSTVSLQQHDKVAGGAAYVTDASGNKYPGNYLSGVVVKVVLTADGPELYFDDEPVTLAKKTALTESKYFLGLRCSKTAASTTKPFEVKYIGPIK